MKKKWLATFVFGSALFLVACGGGDKEDNNDNANNESPSNETTQVEIEKVAQQKCGTCHGGNLQGMGNYPALNDVGSRLSQDEILDIIENGKNNMPAGLVKGEEAEAMAKWLAEQK
ncbi:cytochrome c551 [Lysinibacillus sp. 54212]|uniref:cytochrome c551 n=1 Tax=Lysinibacillus sp. 54212 TaxID=3119829 RepID=UPI002FCC8C47